MYAARVSSDEIKKGCDARRKHKVACNLSRACAVRVDTRRLVSSSQVVCGLDLLVG